MNEQEIFSRLPANVLKPWLQKERDESYKYLAEATDTVAIYRAQGRVKLIEKMLSLLDR